MKKLICLISTEGKPTKQITKEVMDAFHKYNKVKAQVEETMRKEENTPCATYQKND